METIANYAFRYSQMEELDLSDCTSLKTIGDYAFNQSPLKSLNLSNCSSLVTIDHAAFVRAQLTELDLSGCTSLKKISQRAFSASPLQKLDLSKCISLEVIDYSAFKGSKMKELDLTDCTSLTDIERFAFQNIENNATIFLPDSVVKIGSTGAYPNSAFGYNTPAEGDKTVWVYTTSSNTTLKSATLPARSDRAAVNVYVNMCNINVNLYDEAENTLGKRVVNLLASDIGTDQVVEAPFVRGYKCEKENKKAITVARGFNNVDFYYEKDDKFVLGDGELKTVKLSITNEEDNRYDVNDKEDLMSITVSLNKTGDELIRADSEIRIPINDGYIDVDTFEWPTIDDASNVKRIEFDATTSEIVITTKEIQV